MSQPEERREPSAQEPEVGAGPRAPWRVCKGCGEPFDHGRVQNFCEPCIRKATVVLRDVTKSGSDLGRDQLALTVLLAVDGLAPAPEREPPYLSIAIALSGLSDEALARIACWGSTQPCGHPRAEHEVAVQLLLEAGYDGEIKAKRTDNQVPVKEDETKDGERRNLAPSPKHSVVAGTSDPQPWQDDSRTGLLAQREGLRTALTTLLGAVRQVREQNFIAVGAMIPPTFRPVLLSALEALAAAEQAARQSIEAP